jgi:hypothetical protein
MWRDSSGAWLVGVVAVVGCHRDPPPSAPTPALTTAAAPAPTETDSAPASHLALATDAAPARAHGAPASAPPPQLAGGVVVACSRADWSARPLKPLLAPGKVERSSWPSRPGNPMHPLFTSECSDSPGGPSGAAGAKVTVEGVGIELIEQSAAGNSGRGWAGAQCSFEVWASDSASKTTRLGPSEIPPFNTINAVVRSGSAVWLSVGFNGYTREFPKGGNRIIAIDLCEGRVIWQSKDAVSNGGLLLLDDYLISPFGFTGERRYVYVLNARSGAVVQRLPILENVCPSKSWAPNWRPGERCDAPGQLVGAAHTPRVEEGLLLVDTNTGSSTFRRLDEGGPN